MTLPYERFTGKTIEKLIFKLASDLVLPIESVAPNFFQARKEGELRFKVQSRLVISCFRGEAVLLIFATGSLLKN
ncbi:hypothetical protein NECAME_14439 [Necator americanus]|uniref:Uncharacterized protein n=1 Tax=Necator americanus TaxID=51031 RepID=W2SQI1_NECAM|nr:hypothetical protein NECAME_14439 [Necator americanus]ETN70952.1 hypothetical protein NECAME_14439 [Necator americanus]